MKARLKRAALYARQRALNVLHGLIARQVDRRTTGTQQAIAHAALDSGLKMLGWTDPRHGVMKGKLETDATDFVAATKEATKPLPPTGPTNIMAGLEPVLKDIGERMLADMEKTLNAFPQMDPRVTCNRQPTCLAVVHYASCQRHGRL